MALKLLLKDCLSWIRNFLQLVLSIVVLRYQLYFSPLTSIPILVLQLRLLPILDGQAVLYSFESTPEVRIGVAFGSGGSQSLPATELPGVSSWLVSSSS